MSTPKTRGALPVQALYTAQALAAFIGIGRPRLIRLLEVYDVMTLVVDGVVWVPLTEIERKLEPLWESIVLSRRVAAGAEAKTTSSEE